MLPQSGYAQLLERAPAPNVAIPVAPQTPRARPPAADNRMENVLRGLAQLDLNNTPRAPLGDKKNVHQSPAKVQQPLPAVPVKKPTPPLFGQEPVVINDSDESDDRTGGHERAGALGGRWGKASRLNHLVRQANDASDNQSLAKLVAEFVKVLQDTSSRTLTKEAFAFLDVLNKQLSGPSEFVVPLRQTKSRRTRSKLSTATDTSGFSEDSRVSGTGTGVGSTLRDQRNRLWLLRTGVPRARDNAALGKMVAEFGTVVDQNSNKTLTKDGYAFLQGLAGRLDAIDG